jgi:hypothetical protein
MGEAGGGVRGAMVERSQRESFESFERTNTRLLKGAEIRRVSSLMISQPLCTFLRFSAIAPDPCCPSKISTLFGDQIADCSVNVRRFISYNHLSSTFFRNSHNACNHGWLKVTHHYVHLICINYSQLFRKVLMLGAGFVTPNSQ